MVVADSVLEPLVAEAIVVHVDEEEFHDASLRWHLHRQAVGYQKLTLLSESPPFVENPEVIGFILDWRLHPEHYSSFKNWGAYSQSTAGLIQRLRQDRRDVAIVVLTNFPEDPQLRALLRQGLLREDEVVKKVADQGALINRLLRRAQELQRRPWRLPLQPVACSADLDPLIQLWLEKAQCGFVPPATASTWEGEIAVLARVSDLAAWQCLKGVRTGIAVPRRTGGEWTVTARVRLDLVEAVAQLPFVREIEATRPSNLLYKGRSKSAFLLHLRRGRGWEAGVEWS